MKSFRENTTIEKLKRKYMKKNKINVDVSTIVLDDMALEALSEANCNEEFLSLITTETKERLLVELDDTDFEKVKAIREIGSVYDMEIKKLLKAFEILEYARKEWSKGKDVVLVGHYHQKEIIEEDSKFLIFLGDWLQHYSVTKFDGNNWVQFTWNEL